MKTVAGLIKGKQPDEIRALFNIPDDFSAEEKARFQLANVSSIFFCDF